MPIGGGTKDEENGNFSGIYWGKSKGWWRALYRDPKAPLAELNLTPRTHNLLMREGYTTVDDVIFANHMVLKERLVNIKNGLKAYNELLRKLKELGFA